MAEELFRTERRIVRKLDEADVDAMHSVYGDAVTMEPLGDGETLDSDGCAEWVQVTLRNYERYGYGMSAVCTHAGDVIGFCGIVHPGGQDEPELKYALRSDQWGAGIGTEVARAMLEYGARSFGMRRIIATIAPTNDRSRNVLKKIGMRYVERRVDDDGEADVYEWLLDN